LSNLNISELKRAKGLKDSKRWRLDFIADGAEIGRADRCNAAAETLKSLATPVVSQVETLSSVLANAAANVSSKHSRHLARSVRRPVRCFINTTNDLEQDQGSTRPVVESQRLPVVATTHVEINRSTFSRLASLLADGLLIANTEIETSLRSGFRPQTWCLPSPPDGCHGTIAL